MTLTLIIVLLLVLAAEFVNGLTDSPNAIATVVSTRVLSPLQAVTMAAILNIVGALTTGTAVAVTIGKGIVQPEAITLLTVAAGMLAIVSWSTLAWRWGLPTSETHALVAGLAGAALATAGPSVLLWEGWQKVLIGLVLATVVGFSFGFIVMAVIYRVLFRASLGPVKSAFARLQILSSAFMAYSHGSNDGQKFMGAFSLALFLGGLLPEVQIPVWVIILCGTVMGLGTAFGGWRIIKTMGFKLTRLEPINGFAAETSAGIAIILASFFGIPLSTTQTINTSIMGVGAIRRMSAVNWRVTLDIFRAWLLTFPVCGVLGYVFALAFQQLFS
jgi:PiT family inorganic phosphate transporter